MSETRLSHQECWELLPWLVNDSLDGGEAQRVGDHVESCAICREEVRACRELAGLLADGSSLRRGRSPEDEAVDLLSPERGFARFSARLDVDAGAFDDAAFDDAAFGDAAPDDEAFHDEAVDAADHGPKPRRARRWRHLATATPRPVRALIAAQMAALLVLAVLAVQRSPGPAADGEAADGGSVAAFRTLSTSPAARSPGAAALGEVATGRGAVAVTAAEPQRLRLVFAEEAALADVRQLLVEAGARLVDGPSPFGVYTVELPATDPGETAAQRLERLRRSPAVVFAEPAAIPSAPVATEKPAPAFGDGASR